MFCVFIVMVRSTSRPRQALIFHFCDTHQLPIRHSNKSHHKQCSLRDEVYCYCLIDMRYLCVANMKDERLKTFLKEHANCVEEMHRTKINLVNKTHVRRLTRLFEATRPVEGILSQYTPAHLSASIVESDTSSDDDVSNPINDL